MDHFETIYRSKADAYHRMISAEDADHHLITALAELTPGSSISALAGKRLLDVGSGTGRIPLLVRGQPRRTIAVDLHRGMLLQNQAERDQVSGDWDLVQSDLQQLPLPAKWADLTTAGWVLGHLRSWFSDDWKAHIGAGLCEMQRVTAPTGWLVIFETLGTGSLQPAPPTPDLEEYYLWLEEKWGFSRRVISTDYVFPSVDDAIACTEFFFGSELADRVHRNQWSRIPEWTGMWVKRI